MFAMNTKLKAFTAGAASLFVMGGAGDAIAQEAPANEADKPAAVAPVNDYAHEKELGAYDREKRILIARGEQYCDANECSEAEKTAHIQGLVLNFDYWIKTLRGLPKYRHQDIVIVIRDAGTNAYDDFTQSQRNKGGITGHENGAGQLGFENIR